jgi:hypothetical protein
MHRAFLVAAGVAAVTMHLAYSQDIYTSRRDPNTELFTRHPESTNAGYARVDRFDELFATHTSPGNAVQQMVPDRWWQQ